MEKKYSSFFTVILCFGLTLFLTAVFVNNAFARHDEIKAGWAANGISTSLHNLSATGPMLATVLGGAAAPVIVPGLQEDGGDFVVNDLGQTVYWGVNKARVSTEMCVFCHTPHFTDRSAGPLWNRYFSGTVEAYGTTIAKNVDGNGNANMFSTIGCLSCHDGVTTFDSIINQPGKGIGDVGALVNPPVPTWDPDRGGWDYYDSKITWQFSMAGGNQYC